MVAVITLGNRQYQVSKDFEFLAEKTDKKVGEEFKPKVLLFSENNTIHIGQPDLKSATVTLKVLEELKADKVRGFTYRKRTNRKKQWGHRQTLHKYKVVNISSN